VNIQTDSIPITNLEDTTAHKFVEKIPEFPGGMDELSKYLFKNITYPENCRKKGISGVVLVEFIVEKDGSISNIKVIVSAHPDLDAEAIRVIKSFPKWTPGTQLGKPVRVFFQLPIRFTVS
jgi:protein TonB